jgi:hypothetical protein
VNAFRTTVANLAFRAISEERVTLAEQVIVQDAAFPERA